MTIVHIIVLLATGVVGGFASGLLGVGGGFIMTPVQYFVYADMGMPTDVAVKLAFGTNLLVILPTAVSGTWRHHRKGMVWWKAAITMGSCSLVGAFGGSTIAIHLPGAALKIAFGAVVIAAAIIMLTVRMGNVEQEPRDNPWWWVAWSLSIGVVTGLIGIGGGLFVIPVMTLALRFSMHKAVATSLAMMIFTSTGGVIGYAIGGIGVPDLPAFSIGYVNLTSWFLLAASSIGMAQVGALTAHRLPAKQLRYIFIGLQLWVGFTMLGVLHWPG